MCLSVPFNKICCSLLLWLEAYFELNCARDLKSSRKKILAFPEVNKASNLLKNQLVRKNNVVLYYLYYLYKNARVGDTEVNEK